ncbi:MAG: LPS export ABC transporter permease LptG [Marinobacter sp.]|uniref:LPS export ABC transporter permease LptG n=1 Tax=Marinobacter sp. TaxID=50741 RepID=UPI0032971748
MKKIDRYIGLSFLAGCIPVLLLLLSLFSLLALSAELEDVGEGSYLLPDALLVVALGLPVLLVDLLPVTVLLGGLLGLGALANNLELISMRAAAVSPLRMAVPVGSLAVLLIALVILLQSLVIPQVEFYAAQLRSKTLIEPSSIESGEERAAVRDNEFWTRNQGQFIRIGQVLPDRRLAGIEIYQFDARGMLVTMVQAPVAELLQDNTWMLRQVSETQLDNAHSDTRLKESLVWDGLLSEEQTHALITPASSLAPVDLWRSIQRLERNAMNSSRHRILFWRQLSVPLGLLGMALLALPFLLGSVRSVPVGQRIALGGVIGIGYYLVQQISGHLAGILQWNAALTVLAPGLLILCIALLSLRRVSQGL